MLKLKEIQLNDYCGFRNVKMEFDDIFSCLIAGNGVGKTTILNVITTLLSSLDYNDQKRLEAALRPNIRNIEEKDGAKSFLVIGKFERDGKKYEVHLTEKGFVRNDLLEQSWWWQGLSYYAKFDTVMTDFQLRESLWAQFKEAYEGITGITVEPETFIETDLEDLGLESKIIVGFFLHKPAGKIFSRRASAGEKKIAKTLSQIINLPKDRLPEIVLVDNMEMHVHHKRHLIMFDAVKKIFNGMQVIGTTHSTVIMEKYEPKSQLINLDDLIEAEEQKRLMIKE